MAVSTSAINSIATAEKYASALDTLVTQKAVTGFFADNVMGAMFVGAKTVQIPSMEFEGLGNYDKDNGFPQGKITVSHELFELGMDRAKGMQLDRMDMDETGVANLAGTTLKEYVRTKVVPEMDAYNLSALAKIAADKGHDKEFDAATVYKTFTELENGIQGTAGFDEELVCFVDPIAYAALMNSSELAHSITVSDFKQGDINLKVKTLNGVAIIPVVADRMKTVYTFGEEGFSVHGTARNLNMLMLPKSAASLVKKTEKLRVIAPDNNQDADAYLFQYRVYYDIFVKKSRKEHIYSATSAI